MRAFLDTNVLLYAFVDDVRRPEAQQLLDGTAIISVQCLNEFATVSLRKQRVEWIEIRERIDLIRTGTAHIVPLTDAIHRDGLRIAERYRLSIYDSMIAAAALSAGCDRLWSEDLHHDLVIDDRLRVANPFR
ncbi:PIN domain-containing protein [Sphingomonas sp. 2R-10]|uniref:PIN domain-containing protein n=1 Tax=Sphingomonas sp. 2R-10 TaxID=3045148 RepID=UPI000F796855|nr:PIN domain-containing protein [Sphingomonas sp. 2R-10]MDJ0277297.1 PIN domain-containing protein [Sphingomonas sp. 2R-10]